MRLSVYLFAILLFALVVQSCVDNKRAKNYNDKTLVDEGGLSFIKNGIEGGLTEIKASTIAQTTSKNMRVVNFAKMMITDHTSAGNELMKVESSKLMDKVDTISGDHQQMIAALAARSGADFDKAYMKMMIDDHKKTIQLFTDASYNTSQTIQNFAKKNLPVIRMHLDSANAIYTSLK